jgi:hypothetical protein
MEYETEVKYSVIWVQVRIFMLTIRLLLRYGVDK